MQFLGLWGSDRTAYFLISAATLNSHACLTTVMKSWEGICKKELVDGMGAG